MAAKATILISGRGQMCTVRGASVEVWRRIGGWLVSDHEALQEAVRQIENPSKVSMFLEFLRLLLFSKLNVQRTKVYS